MHFFEVIISYMIH